MKPVREWDEGYILRLPIGEFDWLEAKGRKSLDLSLPGVKESDVLQTLSKALSAFANSGGGVLVYGLVNPSGVSAWSIDDGGIETVGPKRDTREWLETVIPNLVDFPLTSFNVYTILPTTPESQIQLGRALYVVEIPDSLQAPHQAKDNRYYIRAAGRSVPIGHRLVADIMGRRQHPQIQLDFQIEKKLVYTGNPYASLLDPLANRTPRKRIAKYTLRVTARNVGRVYAQYVNVFIGFPALLDYSYDDLEEIKEFVNSEGDAHEVVEYPLENTKRDIVDTQVGLPEAIHKYGPARFTPILPGLSHSWTINLTRKFGEVDHEGLAIDWAVYSDNAVPHQGSIDIADIPVVEQDES